MKPTRLAYALLVGATLNTSTSFSIRAMDLSINDDAITGYDSVTGVEFSSRNVAQNRTVVDIFLNNKQIHAEIDYGAKMLSVVSVRRGSTSPETLLVSDIRNLQNLKMTLPPLVGASTLNSDALGSLINLLSSAPANEELRVYSVGGSVTSICGQVGSPGIALYKLYDGYHADSVTVGPVCYSPPALGRCGAGAGPDPGIGLVQRFTQQCLNHDQCCAATGNSYIGAANVCGNSRGSCRVEFALAAPGFFFAPDCGSTAGNWIDQYGYQFSVAGGDGSGLDGTSTSFTGSMIVSQTAVDTLHCPKVWSLEGVRSGQTMLMTSTNPGGGSSTCAAWVKIQATFTSCNSAAGSFVNNGTSGKWSWSRTNRIAPAVPDIMSKVELGPASIGERSSSRPGMPDIKTTSTGIAVLTIVPQTSIPTHPSSASDGNKAALPTRRE